MFLVWLSSAASAQRLSGGMNHSLYVCADDSLRAWGENGAGQLGNGTNINSIVPGSVPVTGSVLAAAAGRVHSIALTDDGHVWSWGNNTYGQLGDSVLNSRNQPWQVTRLDSIIAISSRYDHCLAIRRDSTVWAWGLNQQGQLGLNHDTVQHWPAQIPWTGSRPIAIAAGDAFSLALTATGEVMAWGDNSLGQLGSSLQDSSLVPILVPNLDSIVAIAAGSVHALALEADGTVWAWGANINGQLGQGNNLPVTGPIPVLNVSNIVKVAAGKYHSLAIDAAGLAYAWGANGIGQLGLSDLLDRSTPQGIPLPADALSIAGGDDHSLFLLADARMFATGKNVVGALGEGSTNSQSSPVKVIGLCEQAAATFDPDMTDRFRIGPGSPVRWKAGEIASSLIRPDGSRIFIMGASVIDSVRSDTTIPCTGSRASNWILLQDSGSAPLRDAPGNPNSTASDPSYFQMGDTSLVPGAAYILGDTVYVQLSAFHNGTFAGNFRGRYGIGTVTILDITRCMGGSDDIDFGRALISDLASDWLYLYGVQRDSVGILRPYLARHALKKNNGPWQYRTNAGWASDPCAAAPISSHAVDSVFSVKIVQGRAYMITQYVDPSFGCNQGNTLIALASDSLVGPFEDPRLLYVAPDSLDDKALLTFSALVHSGGPRCDSLALSYNVDDPSQAGCPGQCDAPATRLHADTWRPRFLHLPFLGLDTLLPSGPQADFQFSSEGDSVFCTTYAQGQILWEFDDGSTATGSQVVHQYLTPGQYHIRLTVTACGTTATAIDTFNYFGLGMALRVFPNPNPGQFQVLATGLPPGSATVTLHNLMGQEVRRWSVVPVAGTLQFQVVFEGAPPLPGVYLLRLTLDEYQESVRVVIQN